MGCPSGVSAYVVVVDLTHMQIIYTLLLLVFSAMWNGMSHLQQKYPEVKPLDARLVGHC